MRLMDERQGGKGVSLVGAIFTLHSLLNTGCPKKHVTLFVKAIIFKPRIVGGWYYTYFEADPLRLETSTNTSHRWF